MAAEDNLQFDLFISLFIHLLFISSCGSVNASEQKSLLLFTKIRKTKLNLPLTCMRLNM